MSRGPVKHGTHVGRLSVYTFVPGEEDRTKPHLDAIFEEGSTNTKRGIIFNALGWVDDNTCISFTVRHISAESARISLSCSLTMLLRGICTLFFGQ